MKLKLTLQRAGGSNVDLLVTADARATVGDIARYLRDADPQRAAAPGDSGAMTLAYVHGDTRALDPALPVGESGLRSGATVALSRSSREFQDPEAIGAAVVLVTDGPDKGREFRLPTGSAFVGRDQTCDITLNDPLVSRRHARINIRDGVDITDLQSANGISVGGAMVSRCTLRPGDRVRLGDTELTLRSAPQTHMTDEAGDSVVRWVRPPRVNAAYAGQTFTAPEPPDPPGRTRFPVVPLIAPLAVGAILYLITRSATSLIFIAFSPLMLIGNAVESRLGGRSAYKAAVATFRDELDSLQASARDAIAEERAGRLAEHPSGAECVRAVENQDDLLWTRRPGEPGFAEFRLGTGTQVSRSSYELPNRRSGAADLHRDIAEALAPFASVDGVPVVARPADEGAIGVAGHRGAVLDLARSIVTQAVALHSPAELVLAGFTSLQSAADWTWLPWLPRASSPHSPVSSRHLVSSPAEATKLISELEALLAERAGVSALDRQPVQPAFLVLVESDAPVEHSRLVELAEAGWRHGIFVLWLAPTRHELPAACRVFFDAHPAADGTGRVGRVGDGVHVEPVRPEAVTEQQATALARRLSPFVDAGARVDDDSDLPRSVSLLGLPGAPLEPTVEAVIGQWTENRSIVTGPYAPAETARHAGTLRAVIGQAAGEPHALDLRADGPHALVGGTTGSGKSELLQTWILAMAAAHSPQRLTFLLVDYKGGSAFSECVSLPHTVGLVTDLSPHLVRRALTSLSAELRHREHVLSAYAAKDLVSLERLGQPDAPPSLVIVVDEFAALVQEVPEFVDGVVNVAQRGRSLGLHLILATQQPAGVIKDKLRANTNLRLALRMADEADSTDVLGSPQAAFFDPAIPGRSVSKTGPGRLVPFQTGYVGGRTHAEAPAPEILAEELRVGSGAAWELPTDPVPSSDSGPTDIQRLVSSISDASIVAGIAPPRKPWLNELAPVYDLSDQSSVPSRRRDDELVFGILDDPQNQVQPTVAFRPDRDGNLAVYGTGGSGKSTLLRAIALAASFTVRGGPCHVYGLDFGARGLSLLEELPHVGSIISGNDDERIGRLIRWLRGLIDERADRYAAANAGTVTEYRRLAHQPDEPRVLLLVDGLPAFRQGYDVGERARLFDTFVSICSDGRPVGVHVILSADRPAGVPTALAATIQQRLVLRLADEADYAFTGLPTDVLKPSSPPGRGLLGEAEVQVAILGSNPEPSAQAREIRRLASAMQRAGVTAAPAIQRLPEWVPLSALPAEADGLPTLGLSSATLAPLGFTAEGPFVVAGPPGSGRTNALRTVVTAVRRQNPAARPYLISAFATDLQTRPDWEMTVIGIDDVAAKAGEAAERIQNGGAHAPLLVVEGLPEFLNSPADIPLQNLIKAALRQGGFVVGEGDVSALTSTYPLLNLVRAGRAGVCLQPDQLDGSIFRTDFPRARRAEFPQGRGFLVRRGTTTTVQLAVDDSDAQALAPNGSGRASAGTSPHSVAANSSLS